MAVTVTRSILWNWKEEEWVVEASQCNVQIEQFYQRWQKSGEMTHSEHLVDQHQQLQPRLVGGGDCVLRCHSLPVLVVHSICAWHMLTVAVATIWFTDVWNHRTIIKSYVTNRNQVEITFLQYYRSFKAQNTSINCTFFQFQRLLTKFQFPSVKYFLSINLAANHIDFNLTGSWVTKLN